MRCKIRVRVKPVQHWSSPEPERGSIFRRAQQFGFHEVQGTMVTARRVWFPPLPRTEVLCVGFGGNPRYGCGSGGGSEKAVSPRSTWASQAAFPEALDPQGGARSALRVRARGTRVRRPPGAASACSRGTVTLARSSCGSPRRRVSFPQRPGGEGAAILPRFPRVGAAEALLSAQGCPGRAPDAHGMPGTPTLAHTCWAYVYTAHSRDIACRGMRPCCDRSSYKGSKL